ncbi:MAG: hypothetical protein V2A56_10175 [bacterium]
MTSILSTMLEKDLRRFKKRWILLGLFVCLYMAITDFCALAAPPSPSPEPPDSTLEAFTRLLALEQYDSAAALEELMLQSDSRQAWGNLLRATRLVAEQADFGDTLGEALYFHSLEAAVSLFSEAINAFPDTLPEVRASWLEAMGTLEGLVAQRYQEVDDRPLAAVTPARKSASFFRQACTFDSSRLSARAGLLFYNFWHDQALHFLSWTPLVTDRREESLRQLEQIVHSTHRARWSTAPGLLWSLIEAGDTERAAVLADSLLQTRGEIRNLLEPAGKALFLDQRWTEAADRYERLITEIRSAPRQNRVREVGALHRLGHIYTAQNRWDQVRRVVREADSLPLTPAERKRKKEDFRRLHVLDKEAQKHFVAE